MIWEFHLILDPKIIESTQVKREEIEGRYPHRDNRDFERQAIIERGEKRAPWEDTKEGKDTILPASSPFEP